MKNLLRFLFIFAGVHFCWAQDLQLRIVTNAAAFKGNFSGNHGEELVVDVYLQNSGKDNLTVITAPKRVLNLDSLKVVYWYDLEGLGGQVVVPNPYVLKPVVLPGNALVKVDEIRIPISAIRKKLDSDRAILGISYEIDKAVASWLTVWTGELKGTSSIK